MGSCSSAKKNVPHSQEVNYINKNDVNRRKASGSSLTMMNARISDTGGEYGRRKSAKLKELDRISKETTLDGK